MQTNPNVQSPVRANTAAALLWASACVTAALIIVQAGRLTGASAQAGVVADRASFTLMTGDSGKGNDLNPAELLFVIDSREQVLMCYEMDDPPKRKLIPRDGYSLEQQFTRARSR